MNDEPLQFKLKHDEDISQSHLFASENVAIKNKIKREKEESEENQIPFRERFDY